MDSLKVKVSFYLHRVEAKSVLKETLHEAGLVPRLEDITNGVAILVKHLIVSVVANE